VLVVVVALATCSLFAATDHVVRKGETLAGIAARYHVSVKEIAAANHIRDPNLIVIGDRLTIPGRPSSASGHSPAYHVRRGDTLDQIARRFGSSVSRLTSANRLRNPNVILIGQRLVIPSAAMPSASRSSSSSGSSAGPTGPINPNPRFHVVKSGESLAAIASRYGVPASQIAYANGIVNGQIYAKSRLFLQARNVAPSASGSSGGTSRHTVKVGDTLAEIAARYGSSVRGIAAANSIRNANVIVVGRQLTIPTGKSASITCPVAGGRFMNDWGFPRVGHYHEGNDLFAARGTPVRAPVSGRIEQVVGSVGGKQFRLWGDDGTTYVGAHMSAFGAHGRVRAGDVIGYVGNTGNATGGPNHLHFEIRPGNGPSVNPYPSLRNAC
jgi:LysM repeat protein